MNFSLPGAHVPDIERENRVLQERFRVALYRLPFKSIPREMINFFALWVTRHGNYFPAQTGISKNYSPHTIVSGRQVDFRKECGYGYGDYVQANTTHVIKNNNLPWTIDCIYLRANDALQGGHEVMDLATGRVVSRQSVIPSVITRMVIDRVELLATRQGYTSLKFVYGKKSKLMLSAADLLEGVGENIFVDEQNLGGELPLDAKWKDDSAPYDEDDELPELIPIYHSELADLLEESRLAEAVDEDVPEPEPGIAEINDDDKSGSDKDLNIFEHDGSLSEEIPDLTSDEEGRPMRMTQTPERYDPSTGESYAQTTKELCHNITSQTATAILQYNEDNAKIFAIVLSQLKQSHGQQFMLSRGLK